MDNLKNIIAAISLSAAVIVIYAIFFQKPMPQDPKNIQSKENKSIETTNTDAPSLDQNEETIKISREEALEEGERILFENENMKGSISLIGEKLMICNLKNLKKN